MKNFNSKTLILILSVLYGFITYAQDETGCTDSAALNYNRWAIINNGSCIYPDTPIYGCTDPKALNDNPWSTIDDGSCVYTDDSLTPVFWPFCIICTDCIDTVIHIIDSAYISKIYINYYNYDTAFNNIPLCITTKWTIVENNGYKWYDYMGIPFKGNGIYFFSLGYNGCYQGGTFDGFTIDLDEKIINNLIATNIENNYSENIELSVYPNPVNDNLKIKFALNKNTQLDINVVNYTGQTVYSETKQYQNGENIIDINTGNFNNGIYFVNIKNTEGVVTTTKFIKTE